MQTSSTIMLPVGSTVEEQTEKKAENSARSKIMAEGKFKTIFEFIKLMLEAACNNPELLSGEISFIKVKYFIVDSIFYVTVIVSELKTKPKKEECGKQVYITHFSGGTINRRK